MLISLTCIRAHHSQQGDETCGHTKHPYRLSTSIRARSCESQLVTLTHDLASKVRKCKTIDLVVLDFSKAFDRGPHQHLMPKLHHNGRDSLYHWISSSLSGRTQKHPMYAGYLTSLRTKDFRCVFRYYYGVNANTVVEGCSISHIRSLHL